MQQKENTIILDVFIFSYLYLAAFPLNVHYEMVVVMVLQNIL